MSSEAVLSFVEMNLKDLDHVPFGLTPLQWLKSVELGLKSVLPEEGSTLGSPPLEAGREHMAFSCPLLPKVQRAQGPLWGTHSGLCRYH